MTSPSPGSTARRCWRTTTRIPEVRFRESGAGGQAASSPRASSRTPRPTSRTRRIGWRSRRWRWCCRSSSGQRHGSHFYPDFAGVACSTNYYPVLDTRPEDGVALVALGLGRTAVDGERAVRLSPGRPLSLPQFATPETTLENAQRQFYALDLDRRADADSPATDPDSGIVRLDLEQAERGWDPGARRIDLLTRQRRRLRRHLAGGDPARDFGAAPQARIVSARALALAPARDREPRAELPGGDRVRSERESGARRPARVRACSRSVPWSSRPPPWTWTRFAPAPHPADFLSASTRALGHGRNRDVADVIYVRPDRFDRRSTAAIANEVGTLNAELVKEGRPYLLIGPGRWGTADPWLGIPVEWHQISGTGAMVETGLREVPVLPSEGTHFFQNLTALGIGYFTIPNGDPESFVDYDWLDAQPARRETRFLAPRPPRESARHPGRRPFAPRSHLRSGRLPPRRGVAPSEVLKDKQPATPRPGPAWRRRP